MPLAQLHDLMQHCAECKLRHMDSRRVELEIAEGRAVAVDRHSVCNHIISYRNLHPARLEPDPVPPPPAEDQNGYTAAFPVAPRSKVRGRMHEVWRKLSA